MSRPEAFVHFDPEELSRTARRLQLRVAERFPDSGLSDVAGQVHLLTVNARARMESFERVSRPLKVATVVFSAIGIGALAMFTIANVRLTEGVWQIENFLESLNATLGSLFFLGAAIVFLVTLEQRLKRSRALGAINELRLMAHIVDMHQLTKDPEPILLSGEPTESSPERSMTPFELSRYFDYCSEMLALLSKIAALYVQQLRDPVVLDAVDAVEALTNGLSGKIWQKIMILDRFSAGGP